MAISVERTALMEFLKIKDDKYFSKAKELREEVEKWLSYTPQTFPHYTRHTVHHSDEIILQASKFLFRDEDPTKPVISLTSIEAYILIASAYLHDSGMVSSDLEKSDILRSEEWKQWTSGSGGGAKRWQEVQTLRDGREPSDDVIRHFLADLQMRFLIAEFIRRAHHLRAASVIQQHQALLGRFAFDDERLQKTIADVCVAHGLRHNELEDKDLYPERRDILGQTVNVRFLAIALRLGDLLDMSYDRACPLLLNASCPLPADSLAHWTQYQRITHFLTATDVIEITADCQTQEEHRVLQDWCQWIVDEVKNAEILMARASRHQNWILPNVSIDGDQPTIKIRKSEKATYIPSKWMLELDQEVIFKRLIYDVYESPNVFIRELIQNALDANRCQMYNDLQKSSMPTPESPTQVAESFRVRYPVKIGLEEIEKPNELSGEREKRQVLVIEDNGIGMDREIIERYFLQVGRSFYTTDEFRRNFQFVPTSQFGIGFLSVFAVSDQVTVETYKQNLSDPSGSIRLTLTGPRTYLLTEVGQRRSSGTRIEVLLREPISKGKLTSLVSDWCKRVEFPILVNDLGSETVVTAEQVDSFTYEIPDATNEAFSLAVRAFPVNRPGIEGELYVLARVYSKGESWADWNWALYTYPSQTPKATTPRFPNKLICLHGITTNESKFLQSPKGMRIDLRGQMYQPTVSRGYVGARRSDLKDIEARLESRWEELLQEHLAISPFAKGPGRWKYKQKLVNYFPLKSFWSSIPEAIQVYKDGEVKLLSLKEVQSSPVITTIIKAKIKPSFTLFKKAGDQKNAGGQVYIPMNGDISILESDLNSLSKAHRAEIFSDRTVDDVRWEEENYLAIDWKLHCGESPFFEDFTDAPCHIIPFPCSPDTIGVTIHKTTNDTYNDILLNAKNPFVSWLVSVKKSYEAGESGVQLEQFKRLIKLFDDAVRYSTYIDKLETYLNGWRNLTSLQPTFSPPEIRLTGEMFYLVKPD